MYCSIPIIPAKEIIILLGDQFFSKSNWTAIDDIKKNDAFPDCKFKLIGITCIDFKTIWEEELTS